jgi:putative serine protease PepD
MSSKSLWTDRPPSADHEWFAAAPPPRRSGGAGPEEPPPETPRRRRAAVGLLVLLAVLFGAGATAIPLLDGDDGERPAAKAAAPLPVSSGSAGDSRVKEIYAQASKGVVNVRVVGSSGGGSGTGFLIDADGTIVTNAHVVADARRAQVRVDESRSPIDAEVVGSDPSTDLAVLRIDPSDAAGLTPLVLADSDDVSVGDDAVAIGYPLGLDRTATACIVSGTGRSIEAPNGFSIDEVIQTDAPINPGNSGGPLLDARGRVIGVNSQIATAGGGGGNVGIGFAVPSNTVREVIPQLVGGGTIARPYLGVSTSESPDGRGAVVREVSSGGPAEDAGLRAASSLTGDDGDVIIAIEGSAISGPEDVADAISDRSVGDRIEVRVRRDGAEETVTVELGRRPTTVP